MADQFTPGQRERLLRILEALPPDRLAKAVACLDEMKDAEHARGIVIGIKDLQTALRVFQWMRWTRQGVVQVGWWVAGAFVIWTQFEEPIREAVRVWLAGQ